MWHKSNEDGEKLNPPLARKHGDTPVLSEQNTSLNQTQYGSHH